MSKNYPYRVVSRSYNTILSFCKYSLAYGYTVIKLSKLNHLSKTEPYCFFCFTHHNNKNEKTTHYLAKPYRCIKIYKICDLNKDNVIKTAKELYTTYKKLQLQEC